MINTWFDERVDEMINTGVDEPLLERSDKGVDEPLLERSDKGVDERHNTGVDERNKLSEVYASGYLSKREMSHIMRNELFWMLS